MIFEIHITVHRSELVKRTDLVLALLLRQKEPFNLVKNLVPVLVIWPGPDNDIAIKKQHNTDSTHKPLPDPLINATSLISGSLTITYTLENLLLPTDELKPFSDYVLYSYQENAYVVIYKTIHLL